MGRFLSCPLVLFAAGVASAVDPAGKKPAAAELEFFESKVRPVLVEHCVSCHGPKKQMAGLRLDTAAGVKAGSDGGPVVVPGDPAKSPMLKAVRRETEAPMPPKEALPADAVAALTEWVKIGAPFPEATVQTDLSAAKNHWAFQPIGDPKVPAGKAGVASPIDRFVAAKLEAKGLTLSPAADKRTLIRRAYIDLIGLPPPADEVDAFFADRLPDAFARVVDRLLASEHYGERWGRYWLDVARYSDTKGYVFDDDRNFPYAYTYRDYVIRSLNEDKPFDRFVAEQIAADKLQLGADKRPLAAMGFLTLGRRFLNNAADIIDDRIDVVCRGLMGLTVGCARCHDHKFDPIPMKDYYSLYGVFASSNEPKDLPQIGESEQPRDFADFEAELARREKAVADLTMNRTAGKITAVMAVAGGVAEPGKQAPRLLNRADRNEITKTQKQVDQYKAASPAAPPRAMILADTARPFDPYVFVRGNPGNHGPSVPRQMLEVVAGPARKPFSGGSGRLDFAKAIASPDNPLTARVIVNRIWAHHFGSGLVMTPSDFGTRSDPPSHPELLDWLAKRFVTDDGWSLKKLHRRIMLSATYQQASTIRPELTKVDVENRLLGRMNRQRLDFESLRDSLLSAAGTLDPKVGGRSADLFKAPYVNRRTVYGFVDRQNLPGTFRAFDFASPDQHSPQRFQTTVPQQALFLMNSPFVVEQAKSLAARSEVGRANVTAAKVNAMYRAALGRPATRIEIALATEFVAAAAWSFGSKLSPWEQFAQVLLQSNELAFVD
jgi:hypothetical protein